MSCKNHFRFSPTIMEAVNPLSDEFAFPFGDSQQNEAIVALLSNKLFPAKQKGSTSSADDSERNELLQKYVLRCLEANSLFFGEWLLQQDGICAAINRSGFVREQIAFLIPGIKELLEKELKKYSQYRVEQREFLLGVAFYVLPDEELNKFIQENVSREKSMQVLEDFIQHLPFRQLEPKSYSCIYKNYSQHRHPKDLDTVRIYQTFLLNNLANLSTQEVNDFLDQNKGRFAGFDYYQSLKEFFANSERKENVAFSPVLQNFYTLYQIETGQKTVAEEFTFLNSFAQNEPGAVFNPAYWQPYQKFLAVNGEREYFSGEEEETENSLSAAEKKTYHEEVFYQLFSNEEFFSEPNIVVFTKIIDFEKMTSQSRQKIKDFLLKEPIPLNQELIQEDLNHYRTKIAEKSFFLGRIAETETDLEAARRYYQIYFHSHSLSTIGTNPIIGVSNFCNKEEYLACLSPLCKQVYMEEYKKYIEQIKQKIKTDNSFRKFFNNSNSIYSTCPVTDFKVSEINYSKIDLTELVNTLETVSVLNPQKFQEDLFFLVKNTQLSGGKTVFQVALENNFSPANWHKVLDVLVDNVLDYTTKFPLSQENNFCVGQLSFINKTLSNNFAHSWQPTYSTETETKLQQIVAHYAQRKESFAQAPQLQWLFFLAANALSQGGKERKSYQLLHQAQADDCWQLSSGRKGRNNYFEKAKINLRINIQKGKRKSS